MDVKNEDFPEEVKAESQKVGAFTVGFFSFVAIALAIAVALIPLLAPKPGEGFDLTPWQEVAGNLHFVTLHLPIGIFVLVFTMEVLGLLSFGKYKPATSLPLFFGVVFGVIAIVQGYMLYLQNGKPNDLLNRHMWGSIAFVGVGALAFTSKVWALRSGAKSPMYGILLAATMATMTLAAHWGGESVHGDPFSPVRNLEEEKQEDKSEEISEEEAGVKLASTEAVDPAEKLAYEEVVVPILDSKCYQCHSVGKKKKGKLLMDSVEALLEGGSEGPALVPGSLEDSLMMVRIHIPADDDPDDERMPPEDKEQLTAEEIAILDWWVSSGAPTEKTMAEAGAPGDILTALGSLVPPETKAAEIEEEKAAKEKVDAEAQAKMSELKATVGALSNEFNGALNFVSQDSSELNFSAVGIRKEFGDDGLAKLTKVGEAITELNLSGTQITNDGLKHLSKMPHLKRLRLNDTQVTDEGLAQLASLPELEFLVLFGTKVGDAGIDELSKVSSLKKLYLGSTKATEEGVKSIKSKLPDLEVNTGI